MMNIFKRKENLSKEELISLIGNIDNAVYYVLLPMFGIGCIIALIGSVLKIEVLIYISIGMLTLFAITLICITKCSKNSWIELKKRLKNTEKTEAD